VIGFEARTFFFEKKEPKNFCETWAGLSGQTEAKMVKSFFAAFFQKSRPSCLTEPAA
jgi:hypothetical protein